MEVKKIIVSAVTAWEDRNRRAVQGEVSINETERGQSVACWEISSNVYLGAKT